MKIQKIKNAIKRKINGYESGINFYSQGGEDMILKNIFRKKIYKPEPGFYVDIGAYHPSNMSNTYSLYVCGWRGINIDARPGCMKAFNKIRPGDINLEIGVGSKEEILTYYFIDEESSMNSFSKDFLVKAGVYEKVKKEIPVQVYSLSSVLEKYKSEFNKIDLLSIDAEGLDMDIIKSNDWEKYRPSVIIIELDCLSLNDVIKNDTAKYLYSLGYESVAKNIIAWNVASVFFVDKNFEY